DRGGSRGGRRCCAPRTSVLRATTTKGARAMAEASIPVDLFNPGQVFACLGFMDAAETLLGGAAATFDWSDSTETRFVLAADGAENPFEHVLRFLASAEVVAVAPTDALLSAWK